MGALLTERGPEFEALLVQWLFYLRQRYWEDPKFSQITVDDAREPMKLTGDQDAHLGRLIALASNFWGQSGGGNMPWQFAPPRNIDEIAEKTHEQLIEYLLEDVTAEYAIFGNSLSIAGDERSAAIYRAASQAQIAATPPAPAPADQSTSQVQHRVPAIDFRFVLDPDLRSTIEQDYSEASGAVQHQLHKAAALLLASVAEGLLLDLLQRPSTTALPLYERATADTLPKAKAGGIDWDRTNLTQLTKTAEDLGLIHPSRIHLIHGMRDFRNTVHPRSEIREKNRPQPLDVPALVAGVGLLADEMRKAQ